MQSEQFDFLVVGSGAAGLVGAIAASLAGLKPLIIEKAAQWGGTTATSGGVLWIPNNDLMVAQGDGEPPEASQSYIRNLIGEDATPTQQAKGEAFLSSAPEMARMLASEGMDWIRSNDHPDYYPDVPGNGVGRTLESNRFDGASLGDRFATMRAHELDIPAIDSSQFATMTRAKTTLPLFLDAAKTMILHKARTIAGQKPLGNGRAIAAALMKIAMAHDIPLRLNTRLADVVVENGAVVAALVEQDGKQMRLDCPAGVLLAAGGFARNKALRQRFQGHADYWTNAIPEDEGDALQLAMKIGADTELTEDSWHMPSIQVGPEQLGLALGLRALPGSIVVNDKAERYMNEARSYMTTGRVMRENGAGDARHWLVMDSRFLSRYIFPELSDKNVRKQMIANGFLRSAETVEGLAQACGLEPAALRATIDRFNQFAELGRDADYGRGDTAYDRYWADPANRPNPSLGAIEKPPYYAALIRPGDLGTNGGIRTDADARVLDTDGQPIPGLYAAGNGSGSPFRNAYPGAGATIAAAATFGYRAAKHAAKLRNKPDGSNMVTTH